MAISTEKSTIFSTSVDVIKSTTVEFIHRTTSWLRHRPDGQPASKDGKGSKEGCADLPRVP